MSRFESRNSFNARDVTGSTVNQINNQAAQELANPEIEALREVIAGLDVRLTDTEWVEYNHTVKTIQESKDPRAIRSAGQRILGILTAAGTASGSIAAIAEAVRKIAG